jgi:hypothetical protein
MGQNPGVLLTGGAGEGTGLTSLVPQPYDCGHDLPVTGYAAFLEELD